MFLDNSRIKSKCSSSCVRFQAQESSFNPKNQVSSSSTKRGQRAHLLSANYKKRFKTHQNEAISPTPSATNMTTTRSQSLAMSSPQAAPALQQPENPESIPAQERSLSPEWITNILSHPMTSEIGQRIQKWVFYQGILDYTNLVITWDPIDFGENRNL